MRLFVSNINYGATEAQLQAVFRAGGYEPERVKLCTDRESGRPRGFAFVEFDDAAEGAEAMRSLDGCMFMERRLNVQQARERENERTTGRN